jgi:peptidoglycan/LPS O-acetylase OafA/YrhL
VATVGVLLAAVPRLLATTNIIGDALSTVFYASNWYSIHNGVAYFSLASGPSPLLHTWSLAIEEQFYLVWPLVVLTVLGLGARRRPRAETVRMLSGGRISLVPSAVTERDPAWARRRRLHLLFLLASFGALGSALLMAFLAPDGYTTRAYYGTDSRAQALLVGAALAAGLALWKKESERPRFVQLATGLGVLGIIGTAVLWANVYEASTFAFSGGFLVASLSAGMMVLGAVAAPKGPAARLLEIAPLPSLGRISYGVYLWYWPVLLVMSGSRLHWGVYPLFAARVAVTVFVAALSARYIEVPIRRGALSEWRSWVAAPAGAVLAIGAIAASTLVPVGASVSTPPGRTVTTLPQPTALSPIPPVVGPAKRVKILLVGDSIVATLGVGLAQLAANANVQIINEGIPGCSVTEQQEIRVLFYELPPGSPCNSTNPDALFNQWRKWVDTYNPDVVLYAARGETFDQQVHGRWQSIGQSSFDAYVESRYRQGTEVLGSRGATVVLMTSPYYNSGAMPSGGIWPEDQASRVDIDNATIRTVANSVTPAAGGRVLVYDLNLVVSPGHQYAGNVGSVNLRCTDGVHFSASGGSYVGQQLLPDVIALGQAHATAAPVGTWAGTPPPATPTWFTDLPCR